MTSWQETCAHTQATEHIALSGATCDDSLFLQGILDPTLELAKLEKKLSEASSRADAIKRKQSLPSYADKTPQSVQADDAERLAKAETEMAAAREHMEEMRKMIAEQQ